MMLRPLLVLGAVYFPAILFLRRKTKLTEKFYWPPWYFVVALILSYFLQPLFLKVTNDWRFLFACSRWAGYTMSALIYLLGWRMGRTKIEWLICLMLVLSMHVLAEEFTDLALPVFYSRQ